ncbi:MAG: hypothetical protein COX79_05070 [Candidatus Levybacteria bacterium CG_4_10_14_0_2_um_filter_36_16]|nr:MAG: hypothetical protein COU26_04770 [Candidatus Levybacteria bacterium CG10_big_fil_rev_8_21_14_0_10_36_30]PIZ96501.1 MAG: hypothetical protein COX79_05070 [Candidatus Levybacteria bacterium CG_4_10_14_0_2_um_filter_36_16]PJA90777.1 MAG: hypothetical protein CO136_00600 [Candidatus Levybacteria bacterium CG_4_9_14_3_um_filter_36_7]
MKTIYKQISRNNIVRLLTSTGYLYFALSVIFSQIAFNMLNIVLIFLVFYITSSNFAVSMLVLTILAPQIFLSFFGGVVADTKNKKNILVFGNFARSIALLILFVRPYSLPVIYFVTLVVSVITQFYVPAEAPLIPHLTKKKYLVAANSIFGIGLFGSILIGYVLAGPVINGLGRAGAFLFLSGVFLLAAFFALLIPYVPRLKKRDIVDALGFSNVLKVKKSIRDEFSESAKLLRSKSGVGSAFFLLIFSQVIVLILATLVPGYAKTILQVPAEDLSILLFAPAALGMIIAALFFGSIFQKSDKQKIMTIGVFISGIVLLLFPLTSRIISRDFVQFLNPFLPGFLKINVYHFVLLIAFFAGIANALIFVPSQAIIQEKVPENFRSKIYGLLFALIGAFSLFPIIIAGGVADIFGVGTVLVCMGIVIILIGIIRSKILLFKLKLGQ